MNYNLKLEIGALRPGALPGGTDAHLAPDSRTTGLAHRKPGQFRPWPASRESLEPETWKPGAGPGLEDQETCCRRLQAWNEETLVETPHRALQELGLLGAGRTWVRFEHLLQATAMYRWHYHDEAYAMYGLP